MIDDETHCAQQANGPHNYMLNGECLEEPANGPPVLRRTPLPANVVQLLVSATEYNQFSANSRIPHILKRRDSPGHVLVKSFEMRDDQLWANYCDVAFDGPRLVEHNPTSSEWLELAKKLHLEEV